MRDTVQALDRKVQAPPPGREPGCLSQDAAIVIAALRAQVAALERELKAAEAFGREVHRLLRCC